MAKTTTAAADVQWLIAFALADLSAYRPSDWLRLREDLTGFLSRGIPGFRTVPDATLQEVSEQELTALQARASDTVNLVLMTGRDAAAADARIPAEQKRGSRLANVSVTQPLDVAATQWHVGADPTDARRVSVHVSGDLAALFVVRSMLLLGREGAENIHRCPVCSRPFWRVGRKTYCSRPCTNKAVFGAWLKTPKGRSRRKREAKMARERRAYRKRLAEMRSRRAKGGRA